MTREEAINEIKSWAIPSKTAREVLETLVPELAESEDERIRKRIRLCLDECVHSDIIRDYERVECLDYLEKRKESIEKEYVFRPLAGTDIATAAIQAIRRAKEGDHLVFAFNGMYIPVNKYNSAKELVDEYEAYLEKQKDLDKMIVVSPEVWDKAISDAYENGKKEGEKQKEHRFCPDAPKEKSVGGYFLSSSHKDKNLDELSQEYVDGVKQYNQEPTWDLVQTAVCYGANWQKEQFEKNRLANCDALSKEECDRETDFAMEIIEKEHRQPTFNDAINYGMRLQKEQKPYEPKNWPADKDNLTQEQKLSEHSAKGRRGRMGGIPEYVRRKAEAFKDKMEPPYDADDICTAYEAGALESAKPAEWSEEDEKKIIFLERLIRYNVPEGQYGWTDGHKGGFVTKLEAISMLKSLRPSWKPSEQEKGALRTAIYVLTEERNFPKAAKQLQAILDAFDGKEARKEWKPSEEQMKALCNAIAITGTCSSLDAVNTSLELESLREQLEKLM